MRYFYIHKENGLDTIEEVDAENFEEFIEFNSMDEVICVKEHYNIKHYFNMEIGKLIAFTINEKEEEGEI